MYIQNHLPAQTALYCTSTVHLESLQLFHILVYPYNSPWQGAVLKQFIQTIFGAKEFGEAYSMKQDAISGLQLVKPLRMHYTSFAIHSNSTHKHYLVLCVFLQNQAVFTICLLFEFGCFPNTTELGLWKWKQEGHGWVMFAKVPNGDNHVIITWY